jgi:hypothetical protein
MAKKTIKTTKTSPTEDTPPAAQAEPSRTQRLVTQSRETLVKMREIATDGVGRRASGPEASRRAAGGRLDLISGAFGCGSVWIRLLGPEKLPGFVSPQGGHVNLAIDLDTLRVWPDREEHRLLGVIGWATTLGAMGGLLGAALGGGIRLLHPRRMFVDCRLRDGRTFAARTDSVTAGALEAIGSAVRDAGANASAS